MDTPKAMVTPPGIKPWLPMIIAALIGALVGTIGAHVDQIKLTMGVFFIVTGVFGLIADPIYRAKIRSRDGRRSPRTKFEIFLLVITVVMILSGVSMVLGY